MKTTNLPNAGLVRIHQIIGDRRTGAPGVLPISRTTFYDRIKQGIYPEPIKLGSRIAMWRVEDVRRMIGETPELEHAKAA